MEMFYNIHIRSQSTLKQLANSMKLPKNSNQFSENKNQSQRLFGCFVDKTVSGVIEFFTFQ